MPEPVSNFQKATESDEFVITAEIGPPKGTNIQPVIDEAEHYLKDKKISAVNVTDIQTAVMRSSSMVGCKLLIDSGIEPVLQMVTRDRNRLALMSDLLSAYILGVRNVLALTGDHITMGDHPGAKAVYDLDSVGLLQAIGHLEDGTDMGLDFKGRPNKLDGAPSFFKGCCVTPCADCVEPQIIKLEKKAEAGAQFCQSQAVYDASAFENFINMAEGIDIPMMAGIVVLKSAGMAKYMNGNVPGVQVPETIIKALSEVPKEDRQKKTVEITAKLIRDLKPLCSGVHLMTLGWDHLVPEIIKEAEL